MERNNNNIIYTAEDIKRYLDGKMQPLEMNAMEKAALNDPFLAEAIEGYELVQEKDWELPLASLKDKIAKEGFSGAKVVSINQSRNNWKKYAAAVLLLGAATTVFLLVNNKKKQSSPQELAKLTVSDTQHAVSAPSNSELQKADSTSPIKSLATIDTKVKSTKLIVAQENIGTIKSVEKSSPVLTEPQSNKQHDLSKERIDYASAEKAEDVRLKKYDSVSSVGENKLAKETLFADKIDNSQSKTPPLLNQQNANSGNIASNAFAKRKDKAEETNRTFIAQVVGPDNNPLPFANINVTNQGFGTYADVKGNVRLVSTDSIIPVEVKSLGYVTQNIVLRSNNQANKIMLKENALSVSDKIDYSKNDAPKKMFKKYSPVQDSTANAEPADGWDNYNTYVLNNTELPDEVVTKNLHGEVEVSFDVKRNGTITNVKVDKSLCGDCDEIAKRLVEQGPQWKVKKGKKAKGKVKVQF